MGVVDGLHTAWRANDVHELDRLHATALQLHMNQWQTIDKNCHIIAGVVSPAFFLILVYDLKRVVVYVFLVNDESAEGMAKAYRDVLEKTEEELSEKGKQAKQFVLSEKNNVAQAKKAVRLIAKQMKM